MTSSARQQGDAADTALPSVRHLSTTTPRATKPHRCVICGLEIETLTKHVKTSYLNLDAVGTNKFRTVRYHLECPIAEDDR